ncbi:MAG: hypothetical protein IKO90_02665 [Bacteroidales bacterium]|nr:hypothetical protein [Bacteroidales bacterium]
MKIPDWLDNLIFNTLGAHYHPVYADMTNIDDNREKTLNYLGTYFPRSYAEAYCIFKEYFEQNLNCFSDKSEISIFDFGSGTGGEIIGLLTLLNERFPKLKKVRIVALDGNQDALLVYEEILSSCEEQLRFLIESRPAHIHINFSKLDVLNSLMDEKFDIIVSFKAICEFAAKQQFDKKNPYQHIAEFLTPKLKNDGMMLLEDITVKDNVSNEWLPEMMDKGLGKAKCRVVAQNEGYNQIYTITHSNKQNDVSKVAWRMIKL